MVYTSLKELTHLRIKKDLEANPLREEFGLIPSLNLKSNEIEAVNISYAKVVKKLLRIVDQLASPQVVVRVRADKFTGFSVYAITELCALQIQTHLIS